jgi:hypothetical protein
MVWASRPRDLEFLPYATYLKLVGTNDKMSPTSGFPTARQLDRQFLTPVDHGYKMLRFLRDLSLLRQRFYRHTESAHLGLISCVEPSIFDCQGSKLVHGLWRFQTFVLPFTRTHQVATPNLFYDTLKPLYMKILCLICKPRNIEIKRRLLCPGKATTTPCKPISMIYYDNSRPICYVFTHATQSSP